MLLHFSNVAICMEMFLTLTICRRFQQCKCLLSSTKDCFQRSRNHPSRIICKFSTFGCSAVIGRSVTSLRRSYCRVLLLQAKISCTNTMKTLPALRRSHDTTSTRVWSSTSDATITPTKQSRNRRKHDHNPPGRARHCCS